MHPILSSQHLTQVLCFPCCFSSSLVILPTTPSLPLAPASALCIPLFVWFPPSCSPFFIFLNIALFTPIFHCCCCYKEAIMLFSNQLISSSLFPVLISAIKTNTPLVLRLPTPTSSRSECDLDCERTGKRVGGSWANLRRQGLRHRGTLFTSADTHSDTKLLCVLS